MNCFSCGKECKNGACVNPDCQWSIIDDDSIFRDRISTLRQLISDLKEDGERLDRSLCAYLDYAPRNLVEQCYDPNGAHVDHAALMERIEKEGI